MNSDKKIEEFTKYIIKEANIETPSSDFVNKVMESVKLESKISLSSVYKPLISKSTWFIITVLIVIVSFFIITETPQDSTLLTKMNFDVFKNLPSINFFEKIHFSNLFTFSFVLFSVLVLFQLVAIKNYFNKQNIG